MEKSIQTSFHTMKILSPSIMIFFIDMIYHRAGSIQDMVCKMCGMLSIGNIMPDKTIIGIINTIPDTSIAATCV